MRLKHVFISEYKNLKNFSLSLDGENFVDIFVGKNGSGKSNLLEALVEIFHHVMSLGDNDAPEIYFNYKVKYEIDGQEVELEWKNQKLFINKGEQERKTLGQTPSVDNLLIYYSGHNDTISKIVNKYHERFLDSIKTASVENVRRLICIGSEYKELLLAVMLMQNDDCRAKRYLKSALGIANLGLRKVVYDSDARPQYSFTQPVLKISLQRPIYARDNKAFDIANQDAEYRYWKPVGKTKVFLEQLHECITNPEGFTITNGYSGESDSYLLHIDIAMLKARLPEYTPLDFFHAFDMLKTLGMMKELSVPLALEGGKEASISHFSDGQFQSVYVYAVTELFKDRECLTLLDEPDAFLHPEWQHTFFDQVNDISENATKTNHIILSSHSAITLISSQTEKVSYIDLKDGKTNHYQVPKKVAIQKLSNSLIEYREQESLLSIINTIQIENKPILFTEGSTDPVIIKEAWYKLYNEEIPFIPFYAFSCSYINQLITDQRIHNEMNGLPIFALFDFDEAFNQWNSLNGEVIVNDPSQGLLKKWENGSAFAFMLPIPDNADIQGQVYKDPATKETFEGNSNCAIEHCFYGCAGTDGYYRSERSPGGETIAFNGDKTLFAKSVVSQLPQDSFELFRPLFQFIKDNSPQIEAIAANS